MRNATRIALGILLTLALVGADSSAASTPATWGAKADGYKSVLIAPYPDAPGCTTHNPKAYHGLWDSVRGCHYGQPEWGHHGADPHVLDDVFGRQIYALMGGEGPGHPWQTRNAETGELENDVKHPGYYWIILKGLECTATNRITDVRMLVHQHTQLDFMTQRHSLVMEVRGCDPVHGIWYARLGGWHDRGDALVDGVPVVGGDVPYDGNLEAQHSSTSPTQIWYTCLHGEAVLHQCIARASLSVHDAFDPTSFDNPMDVGDYACWPAPACRSNATQLRSHLVAVEIVESLAAVVDADGDGLANWAGYATRYGVPVAGCSAPGLDCVPMRFINLPVNVLYECDQVCAQTFFDHDFYKCLSGSVWVTCSSTSPGARPMGWAEPHH